MRLFRLSLATSLFVFALSPAARAALGDPSLLGSGTSGDVVLARAGATAPLCVAADDWPGVRRAAGDLSADIERVTGMKPELNPAPPASARTTVLIGTIGRSTLIDALVKAGKLNVDAIRGKWEAFLIETVEQPLPGVDRALVIAGSDKRGTIYGIYELSEQIGVSPWYWWSDVRPRTGTSSTSSRGGWSRAGPR